LIRKILEREKPAKVEPLFEPTHIYVKAILKLLQGVPVKGLAHITGGGLTGNVPRILQDGLRARIHLKSWPRPEVFQWLQRAGNVAEDEMHRVFNCGIGLVLVVDRETAQSTIDRLVALGEAAYIIGAVEQRKSGSPGTLVV
jgi:phosphoribosylformylglycinamidine cyclo-ligase